MASVTTKLEAVNDILHNASLTKVNSIEGTLTAEVSDAVSTLDKISREVQLRGWNFNTEDEYPFAVESGEINIADNIAEIEFDTRYHGRWEPVVRGSRFYDKLNHSFTGFTETLKAKVVLLFDYEELPQALREYVKIRAARKYQDDFMGDAEGHQFDSSDELTALTLCKSHDNRARKHQFAKSMSYTTPAFHRGPGWRY